MGGCRGECRFNQPCAACDRQGMKSFNTPISDTKESSGSSHGSVTSQSPLARALPARPKDVQPATALPVRKESKGLVENVFSRAVIVSPIVCPEASNPTNSGKFQCYRHHDGEEDVMDVVEYKHCQCSSTNTHFYYDPDCPDTDHIRQVQAFWRFHANEIKVKL